MPGHSVSPAQFVAVVVHGGVLIFRVPGFMFLVVAFLVVVSVCHKGVFVGAGVSFASVFLEPVSWGASSCNSINPFHNNPVLFLSPGLFQSTSKFPQG